MNASDIVLLVDDVPQSVAPLVIELEKEGYTALVASSGEAALQRLDLVTPDAVLLDARMPGLSGFEVCRRIKANSAWLHIPVIFMTGLTETDHVIEGFDAGGVDYVVKPVRSQEVLARLATHLRNARVARLAREAVDIGGHGVVVMDQRGRIAWQSPRAQRWLAAYAGGAPLEGWLADRNGAQRVVGMRAGSTLIARRLGQAALGEVMWLLSEDGNHERRATSRLQNAELTARETDVLSWIAKGKTNRDIADILGISPRTVNKHLEHVFEKLGVETRAAAAALASREFSS